MKIQRFNESDEHNQKLFEDIKVAFYNISDEYDTSFYFGDEIYADPRGDDIPFGSFGISKPNDQVLVKIGYKSNGNNVLLNTIDKVELKIEYLKEELKMYNLLKESLSRIEFSTMRIYESEMTKGNRIFSVCITL